jgi:hypothetical protein
MVTSPGRGQSTGGTLAIGTSPGSGPAAAASPAPAATAPRAAGGGAAPGPATPIAVGLVDGSGMQGALARGSALLPAALAAPRVVSGPAAWRHCAHSFLGAAPGSMAAATWLIGEVPALQRLPLISLPASLPPPLTVRPVLVMCEDFES